MMWCSFVFRIRADADKDIEMFDEWTSKTKSQYKNMDYSSIPKISGMLCNNIHNDVLVSVKRATHSSKA